MSGSVLARTGSTSSPCSAGGRHASRRRVVQRFLRVHDRRHRRLVPTGHRRGIDPAIGRSSLDYSADGSKLYAVVEASDTLDLNGVYRSDSGTATGPWTLIADNATLAASPNTVDDDAGSQSWYDQYVTVDPKDALHVYLGLEGGVRDQ